MEFYRQEYWSGYPFPFPGHLPDPRIKPGSPTLQVDSLPSESPGKPNIGTPNYMWQILTNIKKEIETNTTVLWDFSIPLISMDRLSRQNINKETLALNNTLDEKGS